MEVGVPDATPLDVDYLQTLAVDRGSFAAWPEERKVGIRKREKRLLQKGAVCDDRQAQLVGLVNVGRADGRVENVLHARTARQLYGE